MNKRWWKVHKHRRVVALDGRCYRARRLRQTSCAWIMTVVKTLIYHLENGRLSKPSHSRSLLHASFKWDQQQKPEFEVELLRRKTAALLTTPTPAKIPLPPEPSSPIFNHPSLSHTLYSLILSECFCSGCQTLFSSAPASFCLFLPTFLLQVHHSGPQSEGQKAPQC